MTSRRIRPMTATHLAHLPDPCVRCTFWEASLGDLATSSDHQDRAGTKLEWAQEVSARWGYCGVMAVNDGEIIGFLTMAPPRYVPRLGAFASTPVSQDAAVLMSGRVVDEWQGKGIGRQLVQAAAGLVARRDIRALEAVGTHHVGPSCMLPAAWLMSVGFKVVRPHPITPRLRMDLQTTVRWKPDLGAAWQRLTGLVPQGVPPEPAAFEPMTRDALPTSTP